MVGTVLRSSSFYLVCGWAVAVLVQVSPAAARPLRPSELEYLGTIAPPTLGSDGPRFGYGMSGLEYDPTCAGREDPSPADGFPGCLAATSNKKDDMVGMFDIPAPAKTERGEFAAVPKGDLVVGFFKCSIRPDGSDIQAELDAEPKWVAREIPGIARSTANEWLCTCGHDWYDVTQTDYDSHCWFDFDPEAVSSQGAYGWGKRGDLAFHSQRMAWYLGAVPQPWANAHLAAEGKPFCFSGMQRMGGGCHACSGGPTIYAFPCTRPASQVPGPLMTARQLLGYPRVRPIQVLSKRHPSYSPRSQARGAAWLGDTVLVSALEGGDYWWYGREDPWNDPHSHRNTCKFNGGEPDSCFLDFGPALPPGTKDRCHPDSKGFHALLDPDGTGGPQYTATLQFYDASELAQVAAGKRKPSSVLPYALRAAPPELWNTNCASPGDLAFDPVRQILYWVELNGNRPLIHVYSVTAIASGEQ